MSMKGTVIEMTYKSWKDKNNKDFKDWLRARRFHWFGYERPPNGSFIQIWVALSTQDAPNLVSKRAIYWDSTPQNLGGWKLRLELDLYWKRRYIRADDYILAWIDETAGYLLENWRVHYIDLTKNFGLYTGLNMGVFAYYPTRNYFWRTEDVNGAAYFSDVDPLNGLLVDYGMWA